MSEGLIVREKESTPKKERRASPRTESKDVGRLTLEGVFSKLIVMVASSLKAIAFRTVSKAASALARVPGHDGFTRLSSTDAYQLEHHHRQVAP